MILSSPPKTRLDTTNRAFYHHKSCERVGKLPLAHSPYVYMVHFGFNSSCCVASKIFNEGISTDYLNNIRVVQGSKRHYIPRSAEILISLQHRGILSYYCSLILIN